MNMALPAGVESRAPAAEGPPRNIFEHAILAEYCDFPSAPAAGVLRRLATVTLPARFRPPSRQFTRRVPVKSTPSKLLPCAGPLDQTPDPGYGCGPSPHIPAGNMSEHGGMPDRRHRSEAFCARSTAVRCDSKPVVTPRHIDTPSDCGILPGPLQPYWRRIGSPTTAVPALGVFWPYPPSALGTPGLRFAPCPVIYRW